MAWWKITEVATGSTQYIEELVGQVMADDYPSLDYDLEEVDEVPDEPYSMWTGSAWGVDYDALSRDIEREMKHSSAATYAQYVVPEMAPIYSAKLRLAEEVLAVDPLDVAALAVVEARVRDDTLASMIEDARAAAKALVEAARVAEDPEAMRAAAIIDWVPVLSDIDTYLASL